MTVFQMIAYAGGFDEWADTENIMIIRMVNGRQRNIPYNLRKALSGKYPELNIRLRSFDTIYIP
jgi:protein involved in polysaccharide export with SLBB domain